MQWNPKDVLVQDRVDKSGSRINNLGIGEGLRATRPSIEECGCLLEIPNGILVQIT